MRQTSQSRGFPRKIHSFRYVPPSSLPQSSSFHVSRVPSSPCPYVFRLSACSTSAGCRWMHGFYSFRSCILRNPESLSAFFCSLPVSLFLLAWPGCLQCAPAYQGLGCVLRQPSRTHDGQFRRASRDHATPALIHPLTSSQIPRLQALPLRRRRRAQGVSRPQGILRAALTRPQRPPQWRHEGGP